MKWSLPLAHTSRQARCVCHPALCAMMRAAHKQCGGECHCKELKLSLGQFSGGPALDRTHGKGAMSAPADGQRPLLQQQRATSALIYRKNATIAEPRRNQSVGPSYTCCEGAGIISGMGDPAIPPVTPQQGDLARKRSRFARFGFGGLCLLVSIVIFAVQQAGSDLNPSPSWIAGLAWYFVAATLMIVGIWRWDRSAEQRWAHRTIFTVLVLFAMASLGYGPIQRQYTAEHSKRPLHTTSGPAARRSHIHVTGFHFTAPDAAGGHADVRVFFENNGNLEADDVVSCAHTAFYPFESNVVERLKLEDSLFNDVPQVDVKTYKGAFTLPYGTDRSVVVSSSAWPETRVEAFMNGRGVLYVAGILSYSDAHGAYRSTYCAYVRVDGQTYFCNRHNDEP